LRMSFFAQKWNKALSLARSPAEKRWLQVFGGLLLASSAYELLRPLKDVRGKVVLITGGGAGLGRALAFQFAGIGARLVLWDLDGAALSATAAELRERYPGSAPLTAVCDVSDPTAVYAEATRTLAAAGPVFTVVGNAGTVSGRDLLSTPDHKIELTFAVNALQHAWLAKAFLPAMLDAREGHFLVVSSVTAFVGAPKMIDYSASKAASRALALALRAELRAAGHGDRIGVTIVCPSHIETGLFKGFSTPLIPAMTPEYVASCSVAAFQRGEVELVLPGLVRLGVVLRALLPQWASDAMDRLGGVHAGMQGHDGRASEKAFAIMEKMRGGGK